MSSRHVRFSHLVIVHILDDHDEERHGRWMIDAVNRQHFKRRIERLSRVLEPILITKHRLLRNMKVDKESYKNTDCYNH